MGSGYAPGYFQQKAEAYKSLMSNDTTIADSGVDGEPYDIDPDATSLGPSVNSMPAAFVGSLTNEQRKVYEELMFKLNSNGNLQGERAKVFAINAYAKDKQQLFNYNDIGYSADGKTRKLKEVESFLDLPDDGASTFYPSLSLMMCLLELTDQSRNSYIWRIWNT